jgi:hypothetical protein
MMVKTREADFSPLESYLVDEFSVCVVIAYDEVSTTKAYKMDFNLYRSLGIPNLYSWIKQVTGDEARHFFNIVKVLKLNYPERLDEVPDPVERLIEHEHNGSDYRGTFVMNREGDYYTTDFLEDCRKRILRACTLD